MERLVQSVPGVLTIQAALILGLGLAFVEPILHWFNIPAPLLAEARQLWLMMLILNALALPMRLFPGILGAQNRAYWIYVSLAIGAWAGLAAFVAVDTTIGIGIAIAGTKMFGLTGYIAFSALFGLMGITFWYITLKAPRILNLSPGKLLKDISTSLLVFSALLVAGLLVFRQTITPAYLIAAEGGVAITAFVWFVSLFWKDLLGMFRRLQRARQNQLVSNDAPPMS